MCWQEQVEYIVMLCGLSEDYRPMCDIYWPEDQSGTMKWDGLEVSFLNEKQLNDFYWIREFQIKKNNQTRNITQYHAVGWPDRKVPKPEFLNEFHELLYKIVEYKETPSPKPVVIHCSAGVGRTGTFLS